jgi:hypothetical protein
VTEPIYDSGVVASASTSMTVSATAPSPDLYGGGVYVLYVQITQSNGQTSAWTPVTFTANFEGPGAPLLVAVASNDGTTGQPITTVTAYTQPNLVSEQGSNFETPSGGTAEWLFSNVGTPIVDTTWAADGTHSMQMTSAASGACVMSGPFGTGGNPITAGEQVSAMATVQQPSLTQAMTLSINWYDSLGNFLSLTALQTANANSTGVVLSGVGTAPSGAYFCTLTLTWSATAASQITRVDKIAVFYGANVLGGVPTWSLGGFYGTANTTVEIQYSDDGVTWLDVRNGSALAVPLTGFSPVASVIDYETQPGVQRSYRARGNGVSATITTFVVGSWSNTATATTTTNGYVYLSDPTVPESAVQCLLGSDWQPVIHEELTIYYPIGRDTAVKSTNGTKGIGGTVTLRTSTTAARKALLALLAQTDTLFLQLPEEAYYITTSGDRTGTALASTLAGPQGFSQSDVSVPYLEAAKP